MVEADFSFLFFQEDLKAANNPPLLFGLQRELKCDVHHPSSAYMEDVSPQKRVVKQFLL